ncbi:hypothetical protein [Planctomicrobium sp. SH664]|uniref:hypothetical protein n=1 Tax=Planctomicrobium sp. SH664 TaxID=3448125 RepID=UPI003F5BBD73
MRGCDLNTSGEIWEYVPSSHKTEHHGKRRIVAIGPAGQAILREFLKPDLQAFLFSPADTEARRGGETYSEFSYGRAIIRGCELAFGMPEELRHVTEHVNSTENLTPEFRESYRQKLRQQASDWREKNCWSPNQLRHNFATRARREFGIEAARVTLGHSSAVTSEIYAERDLSAARAVVARIG